MQEFETIKAEWKNSTCRSLCEYARKVLLAQPVVMRTRNLSLDGLIELINGTRAELARLQESRLLSMEERSLLLEQVLRMKELFYQIADQCILK
jgi:hypothetical protein